MRSLLRMIKRGVDGVWTLFNRAFYGKHIGPDVPPALLFRYGFMQRILGFNRNVPWPVHFTSKVQAPEKVDRGTKYPGWSAGCHIDGRNGIVVGENVWIGPRVSIISMNHDLCNYPVYQEGDPIRIGRDTWLATNCIILPGVELGPHTVVAAGAVVTKSFPEGDQVLAGNPAKVLKKLGPYAGREED